MGTLKSSLSSGLAKGQKAAEKQKRKGQQTAGGGKKSAAAYSAAPAKRHAEETETVKSESTPVYTAAKKSSSANAAVASSMHYSSSGSRHSGSHGSLGEVSVYEQRRQQRDAARKDFWNHTLDLLGTASAQAGRGITGISVPVEQQLEESRRQIENINATKESRKRLQQLHELGYVPPRYEDLTTAQNAVDRFLGDRTQITGEKTNWGKLIQGVLYKGSDQAVTSIANAADMLFGGLSEELHTLGVESINAALDMANVIPGVELDYVEPLKEGSALRWSAQKLRDLQQQNQAYFAPNANSSRAAQIIDRFGTSFVAALPMALEAYLLAPAAAGQGMTTQGLNYLSGVSRASGLNALGQMGAEGSRKLLSDPQFWTSYVHAAGGSYQNALEDGISEDDAALYALINGYYNALIEIGGADASLGGINRLPGRLRNIVQRGNESVAVQWLKSILGEMDEEIGQGIIGRGLKAFAGKSVPLVSLDPADHDAIFNPYAALEEGVGGGVNAFLLGSLQSGAALAGQSVSQPSNAPAQQAVYSVNEADYLDLLERKGLLPPESSKNAVPDGTAEDGEQNAESRSLSQHKISGLSGLDAAEDEGSSSALHTYHDPIREKIGSAFQSHPKAMSKILKSLEHRGIEVAYRPGSMSYSPNSESGKPGKLIMDPDASYSAWLHELQHLADDEASGWQGMKILSLPYEELAFEERAYRLEIDFARKNGYSKIAKRLERLLFERRQEILGTQRNNKQPQE